MKYNILLIEDDEIDVMMIQRAFAATGKNTKKLHIVSDGVKALELLRNDDPKNKPRLIILDINMPRMNGLEFLEQLRLDEKISSIPVIILSSSSRDQDICSAYKKQVAGYFIKPVNNSDLKCMIDILYKYWSNSEVRTCCPN